jgi:hypothetical protein
MDVTDRNSDAFKEAYVDKSEYVKTKNSLDAALKKEKPSQTPQDKTTERERELAERLRVLEKEKLRTDFERKLAKGGYSEAEIDEIAEYIESPAELAVKLGEIRGRMAKSIEKNARAELLKTPDPAPPKGKETDVTQDKFNNMGYEERLNVFNTNPELYNQLAKNQ